MERTTVIAMTDLHGLSGHNSDELEELDTVSVSVSVP